MEKDQQTSEIIKETVKRIKKDEKRCKSRQTNRC